MAGAIRIAILANAAQAKRELNSTNRELNGFQRGVGKIGSVAKAGFAAAAVGAGILGAKAVGFVKDSVRAASDLEQSTGAVEAIFGKQADGIKKVAEGAAQSFGLSKNSYQELASVLGAGLKNQGLKDYASQTQKVIGLGADLAAQFGGSTKDAVEAISSLMRGEADPIERYGVSIKQSAINAELAATGQNKLTGAARTQAEAQARLKLLFDQTKNAQGTFARESDTLAGKQQRNAAAWENLKAKMGEVFLPVAVKVQEVLAQKVLPIIEKLFNWISQNAPPAIAAIKGFLDGLKGDGTATKYLDYVKTAFSTILPIIQGIAKAFVDAWPAISSALKSVFESLKTVFGAVKQLWDLFGPTILPLITNTLNMVAGAISGVFQVIAGLFKVIASVMTGDWKGAWEGLKTIVSGAVTIIKTLISGWYDRINILTQGGLDAIKNKFTSTWTSIKTGVSEKLESVRTTIGSKIDSAKSKISGTLATIKTTWSSAWTWMKTKLSEAWNSMVSAVAAKITSVKEKVSGLKSKITSIFSNAGAWLKDAGRRIIQGLLDGINELIGRVKDKLNSLTNLIPDWKGPASKDATLLFNAGKLIMQSLVNGFDAGEPGIQAKLGSLTRFIQRGLDGVMSPTLTPTLSLDVVGGALSTSGAYGSPAAVYDITVTVPVGASPADVGREIVKSIEAYEAAGGRRRAA